jgi:hypothetical protein
MESGAYVMLAMVSGMAEKMANRRLPKLPVLGFREGVFILQIDRQCAEWTIAARP